MLQPRASRGSDTKSSIIGGHRLCCHTLLSTLLAMGSSVPGRLLGPGLAQPRLLPLARRPSSWVQVAVMARGPGTGRPRAFGQSQAARLGASSLSDSAEPEIRPTPLAANSGEAEYLECQRPHRDRHGDSRRDVPRAPAAGMPKLALSSELVTTAAGQWPGRALPASQLETHHHGPQAAAHWHWHTDTAAT